MRLAIITPLLLLAACQVSKDTANEEVSVQLNGEVAENGIQDVASDLERAAGDASNELDRAGDAIGNRVGRIDVDLDTSKEPGEPAPDQPVANRN